MSVTNCSEFLNQLGQWMEGDRSAEAQSHLRTCPECRNTVKDLDSIHEAARSMGKLEPDPPDRIWSSLRARLEQEGLLHIDEPRGWTHAVGDWFDSVFSAVPRPALAGAYLLAIVGIGAALAVPGYRRVSWNDNAIRPLNAQLNAEQNTIGLTDFDPAVTASIEKNLAIVDNYIALCKKSVQEDPGNEIARDYLYDAYQQKADLLAQISERGAGQ